MSGLSGLLAELEAAMAAQRHAVVTGDTGAVVQLNQELNRLGEAIGSLAKELNQGVCLLQLRRAADQIAVNRQLLERALYRTRYMLSLMTGRPSNRHLVDRRA